VVHDESAEHGWSTRALERQISTFYYERLLASSDRREVEQEAASNIAPLQQNPREFVRDPVMLEFLGLSGFPYCTKWHQDAQNHGTRWPRKWPYISFNMPRYVTERYNSNL
jgi:predicted nuclease of restriction endonuclease-like (RecB) superfamily